MLSISIMFAIIVTGAVLWLINAYVPMDTVTKSVFNSLIIIATVMWILTAFGIFNS